jgi:hypothetical protein
MFTMEKMEGDTSEASLMVVMTGQASAFAPPINSTIGGAFWRRQFSRRGQCCLGPMLGHPRLWFVWAATRTCGEDPRSGGLTDGNQGRHSSPLMMPRSEGLGESQHSGQDCGPHSDHGTRVAGRHHQPDCPGTTCPHF